MTLSTVLSELDGSGGGVRHGAGPVVDGQLLQAVAEHPLPLAQELHPLLRAAVPRPGGGGDFGAEILNVRSNRPSLKPPCVKLWKFRKSAQVR